MSFTLESNNCWLLSLNILKDCVIEPTVVSTVSNFRVSALMVSLASGLVINESFLQEKKNSIKKANAVMDGIFFIEKQNYVKR